MKKIKKVKKIKEEEVVKTPSDVKVDEVSKKAKEAAKELKEYLKKNKLDPTKDWTKDKKHGKKILELSTIINAERSKVKDNLDKNKKEKTVEKEVKKTKKIAGATAKYDYPLVDGKPMTADQKKKYRTKMRQDAKAGEKEANKPKNPAMVEKKKKVVKKEETKEKEVSKKKVAKKVKKEED